MFIWMYWSPHPSCKISSTSYCWFVCNHRYGSSYYPQSRRSLPWLDPPTSLSRVSLVGTAPHSQMETGFPILLYMNSAFNLHVSLSLTQGKDSPTLSAAFSLKDRSSCREKDQHNWIRAVGEFSLLGSCQPSSSQLLWQLISCSTNCRHSMCSHWRVLTTIVSVLIFHCLDIDVPLFCLMAQKSTLASLT